MKRKRTVFRMLVSGILTASLLAGPAQAANSEIRVGSYKGSTLAVGERSGLIIGPNGAEYTASSSAPKTVAVEQVLTFWVAVAKAPGTATISVTNGAGGTGSLTLTVGSTTTATTETVQDTGLDLSANMDIRLKMVEYINQIRRENGLAELSVSEALMNAAQDVSSQRVSEHRPYDHMILPKYGWPYGAMYNLNTMGRADAPNAAEIAVSDWINSPGHLQTMLIEDAVYIGTGVTIAGGRIYCYMAVGSPNWANAYT